MAQDPNNRVPMGISFGASPDGKTWMLKMQSNTPIDEPTFLLLVLQQLTAYVTEKTLGLSLQDLRAPELTPSLPSPKEVVDQFLKELERKKQQGE